ncbi:MAG: carbohydrate kinase family protein [Gemmataceae bacterium]
MNRGVLCAGIIVADHISSPISHVPAAGELVLAEQMLLTLGGCAANVAVDLVKLGVPARVACCVGDDIFGQVVGGMLREAGVDVSGMTELSGQTTSQTLIVNVRKQDRRFIHTFGANAQFGIEHLPMPTENEGILYLGGYLILPRMDPMALATRFRAARAAGLKTVLDVVTPGPADYLPALLPLLPEVDVFLPNDHEAKLICGVDDPLAQARFFHERGAATVLITQGERGCVLVQDGLHLRAGAFAMDYVDGTGGGDAFAAGYMAGMLAGLDAEGCLRLASAVGASCVRALGTTAGVFTRAEAEAFIAKHPLPVERLK